MEKRRREFVTGRARAREALAGLGLPPSPIGSGAKGEPLWPAGVTGSITHCERYRASAVARSSSVLMLGIDAERNAPLREGIWEQVAHGRERELRDGSSDGGPHLDAVLFSAKEAIFKAWYPLTRRWLGFGDAELAIDGSGTFTARLLVPQTVVSGVQLRELAGSWDGGCGCGRDGRARSKRTRAWNRLTGGGRPKTADPCRALHNWANASRCFGGALRAAIATRSQ